MDNLVIATPPFAGRKQSAFPKSILCRATPPNGPSLEVAAMIPTFEARKKALLPRCNTGHEASLRGQLPTRGAVAVAGLAPGLDPAPAGSAVSWGAA